MAWIEYVYEDRDGTLTGYDSRSSAAELRLVTFDGPSRARRAGLGVATWWSVALASAFIPVAHLVLVPGLVAFGVYSGVRRYRETVILLSVTGACPDCDHEQTITVGAAWAATLSVSCAHCGRHLRLTS